MKKIFIRENLTGILEIENDQGKKTQYIPNYSLKESRILLHNFYNQKIKKKCKIKNYFIIDDINWLPTMITPLYWRYFFTYVKYKPLINQYLSGELDFIFKNDGRLKSFIKTLDFKNHSIGHKLTRKTLSRFIQFRNYIVIKLIRKFDILLFQYKINDFRMKETTDELTKEKISFVIICPILNFRGLIRNFLNLNVLFFQSPMNYFSPGSGQELETNDPLMTGAFHLVEREVSAFQQAMVYYKKSFRKLKFKIFLGLDDTNFIFPLLYALKKMQVQTIGFQHGIYARANETYVLEHFEKFEYYDKLIIWGEYWKNIILKTNKIWNEQYLLIGKNKSTYNFNQTTNNLSNTNTSLNPSSKKILIPYEFLSNTYKIGNYITLLIDKGFQIYFKPRLNEEPIASQLESYCLDEKYQSQVQIIKNITPTFMNEVSVIAGTQTTLIIDLLPYGKPIWVFDTEFSLLEDLIEEGFAKKVTLDDILHIEERKYLFEINKNKIDSHYFDAQISITSLIKKECAF